MSIKKEVTPLSEKFLEAFNEKVSRMDKKPLSEETQIQKLQEQISMVDRKLNAARIGGVGHLGKLSMEKARLQEQLAQLSEAANLKNDPSHTKNPFKYYKKPTNKKEAQSNVNYWHYVGMASNQEIEDMGEVPASYKTYAKSMKNDAMRELKKFSEEVELDEAVNAKAIQKAVDDGKSMDVIVGMFANKRTTNTDEIRKVVKDYMWKKRMKKEDVEITELHTSLLEAHGIEKKVAERIKKVFDDMSTEDRAAFMKSYLKNPKAATEYMFKGMQKMANEDVELEEASQPKWKVQIGKKHYTVTARNTAEADKKAKKLAAKDGNNGVGGKIERISEEMDPVNAKALKGKHSERKDKDIDNDGDVDSSDEYLHKRRQAISKALKKEEVELDEVSTAKLKNYRAANEKDRERLSKEIGFIKGEPTDKQKKLIAKLQRRNTADMLAFKKEAPYLFKASGQKAAKVDASDAYDDPRIHKSYMKYKTQKEEVELDEAKMTDTEVMRAARRLASVGKDAKTKEFGRGLLAYHTKNGSFTPDQVAGLQNIMKNAPFQMAKED